MITQEDIKLIKEVLEKLETEFGFDPFQDEIHEDSDYINLPFPREEDIQVDTDIFLKYCKEFDSLNIHDFNKVTTDTISQRVISLSEFSPLLSLGHFYSETSNGIKLSIISDPILIGIAATKFNEYTKYQPPCSSHIAVEVNYPSKEKRLTNEEEEKIIKSFFFELAHAFKISFSFSTFHHISEYDEEVLNDELNKFSNFLEEYNAGMDLYIMANQSLSPDLKFLTYYKVFEYFAPIYSRISSFEAMRKKLDSSNAINLSAEFLGSIFELTKNYENSLRDKELIKSIIDKTFDLVDIYDSLPTSIKKYLKVERMGYSTKKENIDQIITNLGNVLYNTRNSIVHAKSNYNPTGLECKYEDLDDLNEFMHKASYSTIKWYNRLPEHLKNKK